MPDEDFSVFHLTPKYSANSVAKHYYCIPKMKAFVVILTLGLVIGAIAESSEEKKEKFRQIREYCKRENRIDDAVIQKVKSGEQEYFDRDLKCYSACLFKSVGVINADGTINEDVARSKISTHVSAEKTEEILNKCRTPAEKDLCELAGKIMHCLVQTKVVPIFQ